MIVSGETEEVSFSIDNETKLEDSPSDVADASGGIESVGEHSLSQTTPDAKSNSVNVNVSDDQFVKIVLEAHHTAEMK